MAECITDNEAVRLLELHDSQIRVKMAPGNPRPASADLSWQLDEVAGILYPVVVRSSNDEREHVLVVIVDASCDRGDLPTEVEGFAVVYISPDTQTQQG